MTTLDLAALVGSRICHDLISPIGAIGNGVELMSLAGDGDTSAEVALITQSVTNASARIRFFRIAFGAAPPGQTIPLREIRSVLADVAKGGRISFDWSLPEGAARVDVRAVFLTILCLETAMPHGGDIAVATEGGAITLTARAERVRIDDALWQAIGSPPAAIDAAPAHVQFALLPLALGDAGRRASLEHDDDSILVHLQEI